MPKPQDLAAGIAAGIAAGGDPKETQVEVAASQCNLDPARFAAPSGRSPPYSQHRLWLDRYFLMLHKAHPQLPFNYVCGRTDAAIHAGAAQR